MATIITFYEVLEGMSTETVKARFLTKSAADHVVDRSRYMRVSGPKTITVYDYPQEFLDAELNAKRDAALAKLTDEEKILLGINDLDIVP